MTGPTTNPKAETAAMTAALDALDAAAGRWAQAYAALEAVAAAEWDALRAARKVSDDAEAVAYRAVRDAGYSPAEADRLVSDARSGRRRWLW